MLQIKLFKYVIYIGLITGLYSCSNSDNLDKMAVIPTDALAVMSLDMKNISYQMAWESFTNWEEMNKIQNMNWFNSRDYQQNPLGRTTCRSSYNTFTAICKKTWGLGANLCKTGHPGIWALNTIRNCRFWAFFWGGLVGSTNPACTGHTGARPAMGNRGGKSREKSRGRRGKL